MLLTSVRYAPPVAAGVAASQGPHWLIDPLLAFCIAVGILLGILFRTGWMIDKGEGWPAIRKDLFVSVLIGGANFALAAVIVQYLELSTLQALVAGVMVASTGVKAVLGAAGWAYRKLIADEVSRGNAAQEEQRKLSAQRVFEDRHKDKPNEPS